MVLKNIAFLLFLSGTPLFAESLLGALLADSQKVYAAWKGGASASDALLKHPANKLLRKTDFDFLVAEINLHGIKEFEIQDTKLWLKGMKKPEVDFAHFYDGQLLVDNTIYTFNLEKSLKENYENVLRPALKDYLETSVRPSGNSFFLRSFDSLFFPQAEAFLTGCTPQEATNNASSLTIASAGIYSAVAICKTGNPIGIGVAAGQALAGGYVGYQRAKKEGKNKFCGAVCGFCDNLPGAQGVRALRGLVSPDKHVDVPTVNSSSGK